MDLLINKDQIKFIEFDDSEITIIVNYLDSSHSILHYDSKDIYFVNKRYIDNSSNNLLNINNFEYNNVNKEENNQEEVINGKAINDNEVSVIRKIRRVKWDNE